MSFFKMVALKSMRLTRRARFLTFLTVNRSYSRQGYKSSDYLKNLNDAYTKAGPTIIKVLRTTGIISMLLPVGTLIYAYSVQLSPKEQEVNLPPLLSDVRND